jgi:cell shape-determining protein MreC
MILSLCSSLAEKNCDLNKAREQLEHMETVRKNLTEELAQLRTTLNEKDNDIRK